MPSVLSHPAVSLGLTRWLGVSRAAAIAGAFLAVLPDVDSIGFWLGIPYDSPLGHRGLTHSLAFAAVSAGAAALLLRRAGADRTPAGRLVVFLAACAASHGIFDGMTDGGRGVAYFAPFSDARYFLPWRPIPVSPISVSRFFTRRALPILAGEIVWIWLPCLALALAARLVRGPRKVGTSSRQ